MEIYNGNVFGGRLVVYDNGDYTFIEGNPEDVDAHTTYYRAGYGPYRLQLEAGRIYESYRRLDTGYRLRRELGESAESLESLRAQVRRPEPQPTGERLSTMAHDTRDYAELRQIQERAGIILDIGYNGQLGIKNVSSEIFRQLTSQLPEVSTEATSAPAGIQYIELRNFQYYTWNGRGYARNLRIEEFLQHAREIETLGVLLDWYATLAPVVIGFTMGASAYVLAGRSLMAAIGITAGETISSETAMRTIVSPLIEAAVDNPSAIVLLNLIFGIATGVLTAHVGSGIGRPTTRVPATLRLPSTTAALAEVMPVGFEVPPGAIDLRPGRVPSPRLPSGASTARIAVTESVELIDDASRAITSESRGIESNPIEPSTSSGTPSGIGDEMAGFDGPWELGEVQTTGRSVASGRSRDFGSLETIVITPSQRRFASRIIGQRFNPELAQAWTLAGGGRAARAVEESMIELRALITSGSIEEARILARDTIYANWRNRFWSRVRRTPSLRRLFSVEMGMTFSGESTSAPYYILPNGRKEILTLEHITRLSDDPLRCVDVTNFVFSLIDENSVSLEFIRANDPFQ